MPRCRGSSFRHSFREGVGLYVVLAARYSQPKGNADAACNAHIACHAANIALFLNRQVKYDLAKNEFINDEAANRLRSEAIREPWRV